MHPAPVASWAVKVFRSPILLPFTISRQSLPEAEIVIVELTDADGRVGLGECSPFPSLTGDTVASAEGAARELCESLRNLHPGQAIARLQKLRPEYESKSVTALAGVEIALWDLRARQLDVPVADLCGSANLQVVRSDITLPIMDPANVAGFWAIFGNFGFDVIKIKVSGNLTADLDMIMALWETPSRTDLTYTLDGNQAFTVEHALKLLRQLKERGIEPTCFEQPLPADDWTGLQTLSHLTDVPLCLDETVKTVADCKRVIAEKTARMINLKIMKSGFSQCLEIARLAQNADIKLMIGGMLESEIGMSASLHLACGLGGVLQHDLDTPFFFTDHPAVASPWHENKADLKRKTGPGLGLVLASERW